MTRVLEADFGDIGVAEFHFEAHYRQPIVDPENPYIAVMLEGGLTKRFAARSFALDRGMTVAIPEAATHTAVMGAGGAKVMAVGTTSESACALLRRVRVSQDGGPLVIAHRLAAELRAGDAVAPLAVHAGALELLAAVARIDLPRVTRRPPPWLARVRELLHDPAPPTPGVIAREVGVDPSHLNRVFRRHYGASLAAYARGVRLDRAAAQLTTTQRTIAEIAAAAGYSSQAHFTRAFRRHTGVPPGTYRAIAVR